MITLYLHGRLRTTRADLEAFLARARPVYEEPGGIRTRLQWSLDDAAVFVEIMEYADRATYDADQLRVEQDPTMRALLIEWRSHLDGPPRVAVYVEADLVRDEVGASDVAETGAVRSPATLPG
ncbi:hypothetical protein [Cellulomonas septica]|uniref:hypothetical protein n=1 Tax=Cellulomonas septica TaxID=285080 RepID=UPI001FEBC39B|nr:hypothetical protein [Cellulomonas septica]